MAPSLSVIEIVKYCGQTCNAKQQYNCIIGCHQLALMSYKTLSVSLRSVHSSMQIHVLFEIFTATVVLNFTRCHLNTLDNRHVITIHIQGTN